MRAKTINEIKRGDGLGLLNSGDIIISPGWEKLNSRFPELAERASNNDSMLIHSIVIKNPDVFPYPSRIVRIKDTEFINVPGAPGLLSSLVSGPDVREYVTKVKGWNEKMRVRLSPDNRTAELGWIKPDGQVDVSNYVFYKIDSKNR